MGCIFQEACCRGNSQVVGILLKHENSRYIITARDCEAKIGFIRAVQLGIEEVFSLLAKHCDSKEMFEIRDGENTTGFMTACYWGKVNIVKLLLKHPYYTKEFDNYIKHEIKVMNEGSNPLVYINDVRSGYNFARQNRKKRVYDFFDQKVLEAWNRQQSLMIIQN